MKNLTKSIILFTTYLIFYLNIYLFTTDGNAFITIHPVHYLFLAFAIVLILDLSICRRLSMTNSLIIWDVLYFVLWMIIHDNYLLIIKTSLLSLILELVLFSIAIFLAKKLSQHLNDIELVIQYVILPDGNERVMDMNSAIPIIEDELIRSRRYNYPVSALIIKPNPDKDYPTVEALERAVIEIQEFIKNRYAASKVADLIGNLTRRTDFIIRQDKENRFIIICPEIAHENAELLADRLNHVLYEKLGIKSSFGIATFPENGPSLQAILQQAQETMEEKSEKVDPF